MTLPTYDMNIGSVEIVPVESANLTVELQDQNSPDVKFNLGGQQSVDVNLGDFSKISVSAP